MPTVASRSVTTDGFAPYRSAITTILSDCADFAQLIKVYRATPKGERKDSPAEVAGVEVGPLLGTPDPERICTSILERSNRSLRMRIRRRTSLANAFSRSGRTTGPCPFGTPFTPSAGFRKVCVLHLRWWRQSRTISAYSHRRMRLKRARAVRQGITPFGFGFERRNPVGAVGMWESRQRFPRAVGREGNRLLVFLAFHPTVISTALRGLGFQFQSQALRFVTEFSRRLACCISMAASVSDCAFANRSRSSIFTPGRRKLSH